MAENAVTEASAPDAAAETAPVEIVIVGADGAETRQPTGFCQQNFVERQFAMRSAPLQSFAEIGCWEDNRFGRSLHRRRHLAVGSVDIASSIRQLDVFEYHVNEY